ncbi:MAG: S24/S26 family peptidase [Alistipes senegalensis]|nr:S24/S26 family peptidase [Alistipes senegalensis]
MSDFRSELEKHGKIIYTNVGDSMMPLIKQGRDVLIIQKNDGRLKKYDIPLYQRDSGKYVLHRILKVRENDYIICGDNRCHKETGITDRHIIGLLTGIIRNGREISVTDFRYRVYVHLWCDFFPVRVFLIKVWNFLKRRLK